MSKPTLVQSLLNRPSQTYRTQPEQWQEFHSAKQEMLRIAAAQSDQSLSEYFTPNTSPRTSMAATSRKPSRRSLNDAVHSTRTPSRSSEQRAIYTLSTGSSLSSTSLDGHSIFSDYLSAVGSIDEPHVHLNQKKRFDEDRIKQSQGSNSSTTTTKVVSASTYGMVPVKSTTTPSRSSKSPNISTPPKPISDVKASQNTLPRSTQQGKTNTKGERPTATVNSIPHRPFNAFAPLPESTNATARQQSTPSSSNPKLSMQNEDIQQLSQSTSKLSATTNGTHRENVQPKLPSLQTIDSYHSRRHNISSKTQNGLMSALVEEDEDGDGSGRRPALRHTSQRGRDRKRSQPAITPTSYSSSESGTVTPGPTVKKPPPPLLRRRSRSLDSGTTTRMASQPLSAEVQALSLASRGDLPSIGTQGYTSLVLPRAPMPLSERANGRGGLLGHFSFGLPWNKPSLGADGKVDLTKSGIAQTTMASVEVVRGLSSKGAMFGRSGSWRVLGPLSRRASSSSRSSAPSTNTASSDDHTLKPKPDADATVLGFTSYRTPPSYVPSQSVLVQVWAVGIDGVDGRLVGVRFGSSSAKVKPKWNSEDGDEHQDGNDEADNAKSTQSVSSHNTTPKNPFVALGRSLSLSLKRQKKEVAGETKPSVGRSFSVKSNKFDVASTTSGHEISTKRHSNAPLKPGSVISTPERKRPPTQQPHQRSKTYEHHTPSPSQIPSKVPSKPQKLKAKTKSVSEQLHMETQTHSHLSPAPKDNQVASAPILKDRQVTPISTPDQNNESMPSKSKSKPRPLPRMPNQSPASKSAAVGFIPGRSFVGRVLEVGWELGEEVIRKGEWVVGLADVRKCGALAEFIVVDRHRIHRVPHPGTAVPIDDPNAPASPIWVSSPLMSSPQSRSIALMEEPNTKRSNITRDEYIHAGNMKKEYTHAGNTKKVPTRMLSQPPLTSMLTLEEMALLPLCGIPAYRAVRSFMYAFSDFTKFQSFEHFKQHRRRALILRGHDGAGAMVTQMLIQRGWRVSVHVPFSCVPADAPQDLADGFMRAVEDRARAWGADEVIFDDGEAEDGDDGRAAAVRVIETLTEEGDLFDAILDTVGGKEVREAGERLLRSNGDVAVTNLTSGSVVSGKSRRRGIGLFTTLVGDTPERPIPSAADAFRANLRSFRFGSGDNHRSQTGTEKNSDGATSANKGSDVDGGVQGTVGYAWISVAHEVSEWEGTDVRETLGALLTLALEDGIRPLVEDVGGELMGRPRVVPFERTPGVFVDDGPLSDGGTLVVRIAG